jgi:hypothetical protein
MKKIYLTILLALFFVPFSFAFQVDSFNLSAGSSYEIKVNQSQAINQMIMGTPNNINTENESLELLEVLEITPKGDYQMRLTMIEQKTVVSSPMMSMVEDSENASVGSGLYPALKNTSYTFQMTNKGEIVTISGLDEVKDLLRSELGSNVQASAQIEAIFNEELI